MNNIPFKKMKKKIQIITILMLFCALSINATSLKAPVICYSTPQTYIVGTPITTLMPINNGGTVPATVPGVTTLAGDTTSGRNNGTGAAASFNYPTGVAVDDSGYVYVADKANNMIRKISATGVVTTLAGGSYGFCNGIGTEASFRLTAGIGIDSSGNLYVADQNNNMIRKITPEGLVTTLAGNGSIGCVNGIDTIASFRYPYCVAVDDSGNVYVADKYNHLIRKITANRMVSTLAGNGNIGSVNGTGTVASFNGPSGVTLDNSGNLYVVDQENNMIRKITPNGMVSTLAGNTTPGSVNGIGTLASFNGPSDAAADRWGNLYVADRSNNMIRKITTEGLVTTLAGCTTAGSTNGFFTNAKFNFPVGIAVDTSGNVYIADSHNNMIRKIVQTGYNINPALPPGLNFDATTGYICGTPTDTSLTTDYIITAYNLFGSDTANISITINKVPVVTTQDIIDIADITATGNGTITDLGVPDPIAYGLCWNTSGLPTIADSISDLGSVNAMGSFTASVRNLTANTKYYVRAYCTNIAGTSYGNEVSFTTLKTETIPIANAGTDQTVNEGTIVTLDGSTSSDIDGDSISFKWTAPDGITLSSDTVSMPTFTAPEVTKDTEYTFFLVVNDGKIDSPEDQVVITIKHTTNSNPLAKNEDIQVFTDASKNKVFIKFDQKPQTETWIIIYDVSGKTILRSKAKNIEECLDLSNNPRGLYLIKIVQQSVRTYRIIR